MEPNRRSSTMSPDIESAIMSIASVFAKAIAEELAPLVRGAQQVGPAAALPDLPLTLSVDEAAKVLGFSRNGVYEGVRRGQIPSLRLGRRIRTLTWKLTELLDPEGPR